MVHDSTHFARLPVVASAPLWPDLLEEVIYKRHGSDSYYGAGEWLEMVEVKNRFTGETGTWIILRDTGEIILRCGKGRPRSSSRFPGGVKFTLRDGTQHKVMRPQPLPTWWNGVKAPLSREGRMRERRP